MGRRPEIRVSFPVGQFGLLLLGGRHVLCIILRWDVSVREVGGHETRRPIIFL